MKKTPSEMELTLRGGEIIDGSGSSRYRADVVIADGHIASLAPRSRRRGTRIIDCSGLVITPGFIDIHSHTDENILLNPHALSKAHQGVTTELSGNCGFSPAPLSGEFLSEFQSHMAKKFSLTVNWRSCGEFFDVLAMNRLGINYGLLTGNANLRGAVMGYGNRRPRPDELESMKLLLTGALQQGAWGLSSGLIYVPSSFSDVKELGSMAGVVAGFGGIYATHMRGEGDSLLEALEEAVSVAHQSGVKLQISHLKASGEKNWSKMDSARDIILGARQRGIDVACDHYPYCASSTGLQAVMPPWIREGGLACFLTNLKDPHLRARAAAEMEGSRGWDWAKVVLASPGKGENSWMAGTSVREVSERLHTSPSEAIMDLLLKEEGDVSIFNFAQSEDNVIKVMGYPFSMVGSDAAARSPAGPPGEDLPHPRAYGTFPRILGHYVRERGILTLEEAIKKMTSMPASRLGLSRRGLIREGWWADMVVIDPERVRDTSTYADPHRYPEGIEYVIVNGEVIVEQGSHTGSLPGRVLRRGWD